MNNNSEIFTNEEGFIIIYRQRKENITNPSSFEDFIKIFRDIFKVDTELIEFRYKNKGQNIII